jgi:hypothetical protein
MLSELLGDLDKSREAAGLIRDDLETNCLG